MIVIAALAVVAGGIHLSLGSLLFTLNAIGYFGLAGLLLVVTFVSHPLTIRFGWVPRVGLIFYALASIVAWLFMGGRYDLGYMTKGLELVLIALLLVESALTYGSPMGLARSAVASLRGTTPQG